MVTAEECRYVARKYFALAVSSECEGAREKAIIQGEEWTAHARYWTESKASLTAPTFDEMKVTSVIPYRF